MYSNYEKPMILRLKKSKNEPKRFLNLNDKMQFFNQKYQLLNTFFQANMDFSPWEN